MPGLIAYVTLVANAINYLTTLVLITVLTIRTLGPI